MKKIYDYSCKVSIDGGKTWYSTSIFRHTKYLSEEEVKNKTFESKDLSFEECVAEINNGMIRNAEVTKTLFRGRTQIEISYVDGKSYMTEKNYKPIRYRWFCEEEKLSMKALADLLTADEFCEYLKDRGINTCPIIK